MFKLELESSAQIIAGSEIRSKLLKKGSALFNFLTALRMDLDEFPELREFRAQDEPLQVVLVGSWEPRSLLQERAGKAEGRQVSLNYKWSGRALVLVITDEWYITIHLYNWNMNARPYVLEKVKQCEEKILSMNPEDLLNFICKVVTK